MKVIALLLMFAVSTACQLEPSEIAKPEVSSELGEVRFSLSRTSLGPLAPDGATLAIKVFKDAEGEKGELEKEYDFAIEDEGLYSLDGLTLGAKIFEIVLLDNAGSSLASSSLPMWCSSDNRAWIALF